MSYSNWRMYEEQQTFGSEGFGMIRIMPPGIALPFFMMIVAFCLMVFTKHNWRLRTVLALQVMFLNFGLLLTYTRALWIAALFALGLVLIAIFPIYKAHLALYLVLGVSALLVLFGILGMGHSNNIRSSALVTASIERFISIFTPEETLNSDSLQGRIFETEAGLRSVAINPLIGVGLGNSYRKVSTFMGEAAGYKAGSLADGEVSRFTRFIHNSYLSIAVKMGLPALAIFLWFCAALVFNSALLYRNLPDGQLKAIALAVLASFLGLMLWSAFHQHFVQTEGTAIVGLVAGLVAGIRRIYASGSTLHSGYRGHEARGGDT
jgi:O-antigen ligase